LKLGEQREELLKEHIVKMAKCTFCGKEQEEFKGTFFMKNDGISWYFCSSKCRSNQLKLKRDRRKIRWTEAFHLVREKRLNKEKERLEKLKAERAEKKESEKKVEKVKSSVKKN